VDGITPINSKVPLKTSKLHLHYIGIGLCLTISSVLGQYADTYVSADLQAVTVQIALPLTGILARFFGEEKFTLIKIIGGVVVVIGTLAGVLPALFIPQPASSTTYVTNSVFWIIMSIVATVPTAVSNVWQEVLFQRYDANVLHLVTWTNFYSLIGFMLSLPLAMIPNFGQGLTFVETLDYQFWAIECFLNVPGPSGCQTEAWLPVMLFVIFYLAYGYFLAVVVARESATFQAIVTTLMTPATAIYFAIPVFAGSQFEPLTWYIITALVVIVVGMMVYKLPLSENKSKEEENQSLLPDYKSNSSISGINS